MEQSHFMATVKVGPKSQIVIPKEVREMFGISPGDSLILMADSQRGIALHRQDVMEQISKAIFEGRGAETLPREDPEGLHTFAKAINQAIDQTDGEGGKA